jgi:hypothetical protein
MSPDVLIGASVTLGLAGVGFLLRIAFTTGTSSKRLEDVEKAIAAFEKKFDEKSNGFHRRFTEQDASLDGIREDVTAMRIELELNPQVRLRPKTNA